MGLALVHDSHGVIARIIPPRHDVWERRDNPIWYFGRERTNKIANNDLVPDLKSIMRRVDPSYSGASQGGNETESTEADRRPSRRADS